MEEAWDGVRRQQSNRGVGNIEPIEGLVTNG